MERPPFARIQQIAQSLRDQGIHLPLTETSKTPPPEMGKKADRQIASELKFVPKSELEPKGVPKLEPKVPTEPKTTQELKTTPKPEPELKIEPKGEPEKIELKVEPKTESEKIEETTSESPSDAPVRSRRGRNQG